MRLWYNIYIFWGTCKQEGWGKNDMDAKKILIVDDSALTRRVICDIINSDSRYQVEAMANNGIDALKILETKQFDGIITDINMPRMGGLEFLKELKKMGRP